MQRKAQLAQEYGRSEGYFCRNIKNVSYEKVGK